MKPGVVWTRSAADWAKDQQLFPSQFPVLNVPAIELKSLPLPDNLQELDAILITSAKTVDMIKSNQPSVFEVLQKHRQIYCFGQKTHAALCRNGVDAQLVSACHSLEELSQWVLQNPRPQHVGYLGTRDPAFDMANFFSQHQIQFTHFAVYETRPLAIADELLRLGAQYMPILICLASPSAVQSVLSVLPDPHFTALCIGKTTARALAHLDCGHLLAPDQTVESMAEGAIEWYNNRVEQD